MTMVANWGSSNHDFNLVSNDYFSSCSKPVKIALQILGYVPFTGTVIGSIHAYDILKKDNPISGFESAQIITQIFSFLLFPQVIYGSAVAVKTLINCCNGNQLINSDDIAVM